MITGPRERSHPGDELYPFEMGYLPAFFQRKAEIELHESPENIEKGLRLMREMVRRDKHFNGLTLDDDFLLQFLRCRKYDIARAFSQLKALINLRKKNIEVFTNIKFEPISLAIKNNVVTFLPWRCREGCAILHVELDNWIPDEFPIEEVKRAVVVLLIQALRDPMTQVNGFKVIFNVKSNPLRHLRYCTPSNIYLLYHGTQECVPGRFKSIHLINQSLTLKAAWLLLRPFMSDKFKNRVTFHSSPETVVDYFPRAVLPAKYGGDLEHHDMTDWLRKVTPAGNMAAIIGSSADASGTR